jgi:murein DD-endopeptidase MepM/ murein hydrolase activator NlpD
VPDPSDSGRSHRRRRTDHTSGARPGAAKRRAKRRPLHFLPTPAVAGAAALVVAGIGAVVVSSGAAGTSPAAAHDSLQTLSITTSNLTGTGSYPSTYPGSGTSAMTRVGTDARTGAAADTRNDPGTAAARPASTTALGGDVGLPPGSRNVLQQVSRGVDRATLQQQVEMQAQQRLQALSELAAKVQARARELESDQWVLPLTGYTLSAGFGETSYLWETVHTGLDMSAPEGTPISSVAQGTVTSTKYDGAYGNKTVITLESGTEIWYCHQSSQQVQVGDVVAPGERIGAVGSTGNSTGPHLHIEVRPRGGDPVDPLNAMIEHGLNP